MALKCCVPNCKGNYDPGNKAHVFKFPKQETMRQKWLYAIPRESYKITDYSVVCHRHFKTSDILWTMSAFDSKTGRLLTAPLPKPRLHKNAVPCFFLSSNPGASREEPHKKRSSQMQRKTKGKGLSKTKKAKKGSAAESHRKYEFNKEVSLLQSAHEGMQTGSDNECESLETKEESNVYISQNSYPVPIENEERKPMLLQLLPESDLNPTEVQSETDPDMQFLLSLLPHFKSIPEHLKFEAHFDIMAVIRKYKTAGHNQSSYHLREYDPPQCKEKQNNSSFYAESSDLLQTSAYLKVTPKEEPIDLSSELFISEVVGCEDVEYPRPFV